MAFCRIFNSKGMELAHFNTDSFPNNRHIVVGRSSKCDVSLKHLVADNISRQHFYLERSGAEWTIHDTSRAGIILDGEKVQDLVLQNGMVLRFGQIFFAFGSKGEPTPFRLNWEDPSTGTKDAAVLWPGVNTVGASRDNYVTIRVGDVARFHAKVTVSGDNVILEQLSHFAIVECRGVEVTSAQTLEDGDSFILSDIEVTVTREAVVQHAVENILPAGELARRNKNLEIERNVRPTLIVIAVIVFIGVLIMLILLGTQLIPEAQPVLPTRFGR